MGFEEYHLFERFHAFSNDSKFEAAAHADNGTDDRSVVRSGRDLTYERLVDLECVDWKFPEIAETGISSAEIIDGDLNSPVSERFQDRCSGLGALHQHAFSELKLKRAGIEPCFREDCEYTL